MNADKMKDNRNLGKFPSDATIWRITYIPARHHQRELDFTNLF